VRTSTQFGVDFREMTVLIEASVHVDTFSGVASDKLRGPLIPFTVYRRKTQRLSAAAESRPKVCSCMTYGRNRKVAETVLVFFRRRSQTELRSVSNTHALFIEPVTQSNTTCHTHTHTAHTCSVRRTCRAVQYNVPHTRHTHTLCS